MKEYADYSQRARKMVSGAPRGYLVNQLKFLDNKLNIEIPLQIERVQNRIAFFKECLEIHDNFPDKTLEARAQRMANERERMK